MFVNDKPFCFCEDYGCNGCLDNSAQFIATSPAMFCNQKNETFYAIIPGKVENMNICVLDELGNSVNGTQFTAICTGGNDSPRVLSAYQITQGQIQIVGEPGTICRLQLQTIADFQITRVFNISLLNCPPGLFFNPGSGQCECLTNNRRKNPAVSSCENFQAYIDPLYWIGYKSNDTSADLIMGQCPLGYCYGSNSSTKFLPLDVVDKRSLDHFVCHPSHRTGSCVVSVLMDTVLQ